MPDKALLLILTLLAATAWVPIVVLIHRTRPLLETVGPYGKAAVLCVVCGVFLVAIGMTMGLLYFIYKSLTS